MILASSSLIDGFLGSNFTGQLLVGVQIVGSIVMVATIFGKWASLSAMGHATRRFLRDFATSHDTLDYYLQRRPNVTFGTEWIYKETCDRLLKMISPDVRSLLTGRRDGADATTLSAKEIELVHSTCEHALEEEEIHLEHGMSLIATVIALEPMLGLLGTVWGVLDAFAEMGSAGSANLATIAPSISAALVTTVVGLIVAIPGTCAFNYMNSKIRNLTSDMEGFADELMGRIACEFQEKDI